MTLWSKSNFQIAAIFCGLILLPAGAIWSVDYFVNQDGSPHLYNAYLMLEILRGNPAVSEFAALNPVLIPNLTGHYLLAFLLFFFEAPIASKIFVTFLFASLVASVAWLRAQITQSDDHVTGLLYGTALAFNWMWFLGFYNFILGAAGFALTLGLWWRWREKFNWRRGLVLYLLLLFVFFSHLISFCVLVSILVFLSLAGGRERPGKTTVWTLLAALATLPFLFNYLRLSRSSDRLVPSWNYLESPFSVSGWILQLRSADPFQLLSRKSIPFSDSTSAAFGLFSPSLWLVLGLICLAAATFFWWKQAQSAERRRVLQWLLISFGLCLLWVLAPDNFGKTHGGFLRERILLLGLICFAATFRLGEKKIWGSLAKAFLIFIAAFQTAVVWDYALTTNRLAKEAFEAGTMIAENESFGSIIVNRDGCKFKPIPRTNLTALLAIGKNGRFWDNYEIGYYLFPVVARNPDDRRFIYEFRESNTFDFCDPNEQFDVKFGKLKELLAANHERIEVLLLWGNDARIEALMPNWYQATPFFESGEIRLYRLRGAR